MIHKKNFDNVYISFGLYARMLHYTEHHTAAPARTTYLVLGICRRTNKEGPVGEAWVGIVTEHQTRTGDSLMTVMLTRT